MKNLAISLLEGRDEIRRGTAPDGSLPGILQWEGKLFLFAHLCGNMAAYRRVSYAPLPDEWGMALTEVDLDRISF